MKLAFLLLFKFWKSVKYVKKLICVNVICTGITI